MVQYVEKVIEVSKEEWENNREELEAKLKEYNRLKAEQALPDTASLDSPLAEPAAVANSLYHPVEAYLGEDRSQAMRFFRDNGFLILPDALPTSHLEACRAVVDR